MKKIGKYEILSILGKGAMGIVYKALDPDIDRQVAIKTIRFDLASEETDNEEIMQRFIREAQAAGKLTHPNIITIFDVGREKDLTYIVMQLIEGPSLQRLIAQGEKFSVPDVTKLMEQVCSGLDFAHQHGIVHRDIKPGNILLDKNRRPYICDFGVARVDTSTLTQSGTAVGTPSYMSPEQVMGKKVDKRSDIFSVGCILYEFLTGRRPFEAESITTVIYKIINEEPPSLSEVKKGLPAGFEKVIGKALAKDPNDRYQNCNQLSDDLRNLDKLADKTIAVTVTREAPIPEEEEKEKKEEEEVVEEEKKKGRLGLILGLTIPAFLIILAGGAYFYNEQTGKLPFVTDVAQKITGILGVSSSQSPPLDSLTKEEKLNKAKEGLEKGDYTETVRLAEAVLAEDAGNIAAQDYLNRAKEAMVAQPPPDKGKGVKPTPPPEDEEPVTDPRTLKLNVIKQSYEKGRYNEAVKLADAFLAENPGDVTALDYKNKAETRILINTTLQTGISHYKNGRYSQCMREMEKIFKLEKDHKDARKYWGLADQAIFEAGAKKEILSILETIRKAEENKELEVFDYYIGSSDLKDLKIPDLRWIFNNFNQIQSEVDNSGISIDFKDRTHVEVKFFNFSSAVSKQTGQRERIFEGDIIWTMQKQGNIWKIVKEEKRER
ncbi:MAG: serine/threonine-protein kinase [Candidatus Aminicenantes bacterium]|jgi:serine/threonine-protein kinase